MVLWSGLKRKNIANGVPAPSLLPRIDRGGGKYIPILRSRICETIESCAIVGALYICMWIFAIQEPATYVTVHGCAQKKIRGEGSNGRPWKLYQVPAIECLKQ